MGRSWDIDVKLNSTGDGLVLDPDSDITVTKADAPAKIRFHAKDRLSFDESSLSLNPPPPVGDFEHELKESNTKYVLTDNDTDGTQQGVQYKYSVTAYKDDGTPVSCDPRIINKT